MFSKIMFATLYVSDQDKALDFYTGNFGFEKMADNPGPEGRFLLMSYKGQGWPVLLWPGTGGRPASEADRMGTIFLQSDDLRKDFAELKARGVTFVEPEPEDYTWGVRVTALDPDGNWIALRQQGSSRQREK
ncbi:VOC family protein [Bradyrhizobium sp. LHD-71]|uniref:VOC family protein n=1 Tax=Bradyrhizobium sp. LHD-71 TaxID=3072141 RepID=UPI00280C7882|nr:VOC family protein [Bradyrhizobium sp. LHD-71]MDQ8731107.1 VOC family protein [Bradyrhizobium sp. LHD-71]